MDRVVLHCDMNNFYATVECLYNPELRNKPVVVGGDPELRHGIVLAKNYHAKKYGIKTGDTLLDAQRKCAGLVVLKANFPLYLRFSKLARSIYERYTDRIESFGIDECWLDVTESQNLFGTGEQIADRIREEIKFELGCTVSVGVSWNKIFAKLGSDMKKPDATTVITKDNYKEKVFPLPAEDLLYVGKATKEKLNKLMINTIGEIADADVKTLKNKLGKWGEYLWIFANGYDTSPVAVNGAEGIIKSVGNSTTCLRDLQNVDDVNMMITVMAESVAERLREQGLKGQVVSVNIRDKYLVWWGKQHKIEKPTFISGEILKTAMRLFKENYNFSDPIRGVGVSVSDLTPATDIYQTDFFMTEEKRMKTETAEFAIDDLRRRFGHRIINRGTQLLDRELTNLNPKSEHTIHPVNYFK